MPSGRHRYPRLLPHSVYEVGQIVKTMIESETSGVRRSNLKWAQKTQAPAIIVLATCHVVEGIAEIAQGPMLASATQKRCG